MQINIKVNETVKGQMDEAGVATFILGRIVRRGTMVSHPSGCTAYTYDGMTVVGNWMDNVLQPIRFYKD